MTDDILTPSRISAWLECSHAVTLERRVDNGEMTRPASGVGAFARLVADKGLAHETACLEHYRSVATSLLEIPGRRRGESFERWMARLGDPFVGGHEVTYQVPLAHGGVRGIADFVVRIEDTDGVRFEPVDAKLTRTTAAPAHVLQLCFYAEAIEAHTGVAPRYVHLWLGSGRIESLPVADYAPYWRRMRGHLARLLADSEPADTAAEPCSHCEFCDFAGVCDAEWRAADSLIYVAGISRRDREDLAAGAVTTMSQLAALDPPATPDQTLTRLVGQARLQVAARNLSEGEPPPFAVLRDDPDAPGGWGHGFETLPAPNPGDVIVDFEGHPLWRPDIGLFFLFGVLARDSNGEWAYQARWAHDFEGERELTAWLVEFLTERRAAHPGMHIYHYNHTERSALERLTATHGVGEAALGRLIETGAFVDLLPTVRNGVQIGVESYSLKHVERVTGYIRGHGIDQGAGAVVEYDAYLNSGEPAALERIAAYNRDDVLATLAVRDWLVAQRRPDMQWRVAEFELADAVPALYDRIDQLHRFGPDTPEHLVGDLLGYWRREWLAHLARSLARLEQPPAALHDDPEALSGLVALDRVARLGANGKALDGVAMAFTMDPQPATDFRRGTKVLWSAPDGAPMFSAVDAIAADRGSLELKWSHEHDSSEAPPVSVVRNDWTNPSPKPDALAHFADDLLGNGTVPNRAALALLRRERPRFVAGGGPPGGEFDDDVDEICRWVLELDGTCVAVQGPPGTGKTYRGAHLVHALVDAGRRVGITAFSHAAIANLMAEIVEVFAAHGDSDRLAALVKVPTKPEHSPPGITYVTDNRRCGRDEFNIVAGTTWLFANDIMADAPVDVLVVDEAGQLALADALAATRSARNLVLLGDPLQLPQVAQASHPGGAGRSVLDHVLGDHVTVPADLGVFLHETRRMHPDVCAFISDTIYQGRLVSHPDCSRQTTAAGTGLRWLRADHHGCSTASAAEAEIVRSEIARLMGTPWTDATGTERALSPDDVMVVAPYNDQVRLLKSTLASDPMTAGVPVGTVDRFQGQQAAVVFFTMTASSARDIPRGADFLFSRNRLNVAISRARCLAYLVCTEELLDARAANVEQMRLIATLCSFVEQASTDPR
ncbi:TM0106 family RecB-like putative nuclease [Rhabdothermincola salaria]|uniref:TM0106 family RecB-like putative nuclease n=1 Tax=Rhabdothermincola salaria TaxID=2903142 RepID=UPI003211C4E5